MAPLGAVANQPCCPIEQQLHLLLAHALMPQRLDDQRRGGATRSPCAAVVIDVVVDPGKRAGAGVLLDTQADAVPLRADDVPSDPRVIHGNPVHCVPVTHELPVVAISQYVERSHAEELLDSAGGRAVGYLLKHRVVDVEEFGQALRTVVGGGSRSTPTPCTTAS